MSTRPAQIPEGFAADWASAPGDTPRQRALALTAKYARGRTTLADWAKSLGLGCEPADPVRPDAALPHEQAPAWARADADASDPFAVPPSPMPRADALHACEGDLLLVSDLHVPYHDAAVISQALRKADALGVGRCVVIGDFLDGNQFNAKRGGCQHPRRYQDDVETAREVLRAMLGHLDGIVVVMGNHDRWLAAHMRGQVDQSFQYASYFAEFGDRVRWLDKEQCRAHSGGKEFRLCHGANYSSANPLGVPKRLSGKFGCGVVTGHQHSHESGWSHCGRFQCVSIGGCFDPARFDYVHNSPRTNPSMTRGYAVLKGGWVQDYGIGG